MKFLKGEIIICSDFKIVEYKGVKNLTNNFGSKIFLKNSDEFKINEVKILKEWSENKSNNNEKKCELQKK